ncbi:unnamed protein product [Scytosiphon promiscuus]
MRSSSSSPARWAVLAAGASCFFAASWVESVDTECAATGVTNELAVNSSSDVAALRSLLYSCEGGLFDVTWHGRVAVDFTFTVVNGTSLNITGVMAGSSSSSQLSSDESHADGTTGITAVIEGSTFGNLFDVYSDGTLTLDNLFLEASDMSSSSRNGGAIYAYTFHDETSETFEPLSPAAVNIIDCTFWNYTVASGYGGAIYCERCELSIFGAAFTSNHGSLLSDAPFRGGAIYSTDSAVHIGGGTTFANVWASLGAAIYSNSSELRVEGGTMFTGNSAYGGGAIFSEYSKLHIDGGVAFTRNSAGSFGGGAIHSEHSELHIDGNVTFFNNSVESSLAGGGAILSVEDRLNISGNVAFSWNTAEQIGGAIAVVGPLDLSIIGATFTSNWIVDEFTTPSGGGAVWVDSVGGGTHYFEDLVFDNNSATSDGGALFLSAPSGYAYVRGCTFDRNFAGTQMWLANHGLAQNS